MTLDPADPGNWENPVFCPDEILSDRSSGLLHPIASSNKNRSITPAVERNIVKEPTIEKHLIQNKDVPIRSYNYSYIKTRLQTDYGQKVSLPTIINRAPESTAFT